MFDIERQRRVAVPYAASDDNLVRTAEGWRFARRLITRLHANADAAAVVNAMPAHFVRH